MLTPNFLKIFWSTSLSMTVQCTWQPRNLGSCSSALRQLSSFSDKTESATSTSSVCKRGLCPPRYCILVCCMGSIIDCGMSLSWWSMPARCFMTLSSKAALQPSNSLELPVMMVPSSSSMADEVWPVSFKRSLAAVVVRR